MESINSKAMSTKKLTRLALLTAVIILMAFTPLGYLHIGPFAVTFLTIPVIIGAVTMGPVSGAFLGLIFGITSFVKTFSDVMGEVLLSINPFYTFVLCIVPRVLEGFLCGLIFMLLKKGIKNNIAPAIVASFSCPILNTILYMSSLILLFGNTEYILGLMNGQSVIAFVVAMVGVQAIVEAVVCGFLGSAISITVLKFLKTAK